MQEMTCKIFSMSFWTIPEVSKMYTGDSEPLAHVL
jgi:hypothetical protein